MALFRINIFFQYLILEFIVYFILKRQNQNSSLRRLIVLIILNALVGLILKCFSVISPIFTLAYQVNFLRFHLDNGYNPKISRFSIRTCNTNYVCNMLDTCGRLFFLLNLTMPFIFFFNFDIKFNECLRKLLARNPKANSGTFLVPTAQKQTFSALK